MVNLKLYKVHVTNDHAPIAPCTPIASAALDGINTRPLFEEWEVVDFEFQLLQRGKITTIPNIALIFGGFAFRAELKEMIFPCPHAEFEFLPIRVAGENWLILNCLKTTSGYDPEESIFYRGLEGQIFLINYLVVRDPSLLAAEVFVVDDSNRSTLFVLPAFVDRILRLGLHGVGFKDAGLLLSS